jgi:hypothetical protein
MAVATTHLLDHRPLLSAQSGHPLEREAAPDAPDSQRVG